MTEEILVWLKEQSFLYKMTFLKLLGIRRGERARRPGLGLYQGMSIITYVPSYFG